LAGMLHDVGKLVLVDKLPGPYSDVLRQARERNIRLVDAEKQTLRTTHSAIGGYLLGLWGFSDVILEAVEGHHNPGASSEAGFSPVTAVHAADAIVRSADLPVGTDWTSLLDPGYVSGVDSSRLAEWKQVCESSLLQESSR